MENKIPTGRGGGTAGFPVEDFAHRAQEELGEVRERITQFADRLGDIIRERPVAALFVALGAGYVIGRIIRS